MNNGYAPTLSLRASQSQAFAEQVKPWTLWPLSVGKKITGRFDGVGSNPSFGSGTWLQTITVGAGLAQVARYLGWDPGSLKRYLDGTWRISRDRHDALEAT